LDLEVDLASYQDYVFLSLQRVAAKNNQEVFWFQNFRFNRRSTKLHQELSIVLYLVV
jgi:hypothetical protein